MAIAKSREIRAIEAKRFSSDNAQKIQHLTQTAGKTLETLMSKYDACVSVDRCQLEQALEAINQGALVSARHSVRAAISASTNIAFRWQAWDLHDGIAAIVHACSDRWPYVTDFNRANALEHAQEFFEQARAPEKAYSSNHPSNAEPHHVHC